ncbi:MAG: carboxypeptidase-like regulatory domain-containing protein, partial [Acidobacteriota bacterium]|nr:carboxypeptidase-like regulatory domain-containing protein [Acidobacteriota bacterium]
MSGKKLLLFIGLLILILIIAILLYRRAAALDNLEARQNVTEQTDQSRVAADMKIAASSDDKDAAGPVAAGEKSHEDSTLRKTEKDKSQEPEDTGGSIFGRVVHAETGEPVKGAMVRLISLKFGSKNRTTASDADGNFRFSELPDATYTYYASAEELISYTAKKDVPRQKIDEETRSVGPVVLKMFRAHQLVLSVVSEETGAGIPDASVILGRGVRDVHRTDKGGRITLNLSPEIWDVRAVATGYAEVSRSLDLANNRKTAFQIALPPGGILKGVVVNQDGMPVEKARVGALGGRSLSAESDIDGKYQLEGLALDKSYRVNVYCKGYRGAFFDKVTFEEGSAEIVKDFTLTPQGDHDLVMVGRILDKEDNPLAGVSLQIWGNEETLTESKADGSYRMTLTRNRYHRYHVLLKKDGYASISSNFRGTLKEDKIHQDFVMEPAHSLGGRVLDSAGNPIDQVTISARTKGAYGMFRPLGNDSVKTDADGWFSMENLGEEVELDVSKRGYTRKRVPVTVDRDDLEIVLDGLGRIEGKVIDENGRPVTAFNVKINNMDRRQMLSNYSWGQQGVDFKSGEGRFTLTDLQMSEKKLIIQPVDGAAAGFENVAPAEDPEIRVFEIGASGISLAGTIQDVHGSPLTGIRVGLIVYQKDASTMRYFDWRMWDMNYYERQALSIERMVTTNDGAFHFKNLPKDSQADIILEGQGWTRRHEPKVLNRPEETWENLILTLKRESKIVVHVNREVYESGNIRIYGGSRYSDNTPLEPNRETYEFKALSAGEYTVYMNATGKDQVDTGKQVSLAEGETATVELGFDPTYTISGKAFVAGMPAAGYGLLLAVPGDESRFSRRLVPVADDGSFTFKQVKSGTYHLV